MALAGEAGGFVRAKSKLTGKEEWGGGSYAFPCLRLHRANFAFAPSATQGTLILGRVPVSTGNVQNNEG